jgi:hypothetical protein
LAVTEENEMPVAPWIEVEGPDYVPGIGSLLSSVTVIEADDGSLDARRWEGGYQHRPLGGCGRACRWMPCSDGIKEVSPYQGREGVNNTYDPFVVYASYTCSTYGGANLDEFKENAKAILDRYLSSQIEEEFLTGDLTLVAGSVTPFLSWLDTTIITPTSDPMPRRLGFAALQKALARCLGGHRGVIHVSPALGSLLASDNVIREYEGVFRDAFGNTIVMGSGYSGAGPRQLPVYEVQVDATAGLWSITLFSTPPLAFNAPDSAVQAGIDALGIAMSSVTDSVVGTTTTYQITLLMPLAINLQASDLGLSGGTGLSLIRVQDGGLQYDASGRTEWAYATGPVIVRLGPVTYDVPDEIKDGIIRPTNDVVIRAERVASVQIDSCCLFAVNIDLCDDSCADPDVPEEPPPT